MYIIVSTILIGLTYARNCTIVTEKCPVGEMNWKRRAELFDCLNENGKYTCLKDFENNLVETCVGTVVIRKGVVGCPYILLCRNNEALIGLDEDFFDCPSNKTGCPLKNHTGYALHEIHKYPACTTVDSPEATKGLYNESKDKDSQSKTPWLPIVIAIISIVTVASVAFGIIFYLRRKNVKLPCCGCTNQSEDVERGTKNSLLRDVKLPCCGCTNQSEDVELETKNSLLRDVKLSYREGTSQSKNMEVETKRSLFRTEEAINNEQEDEELSDYEAIDSEKQQFDDESKDAVDCRDSGLIMEKLDEWKEDPVHIGIAGPSVVGKSSFINAMLGTNSTSKKAAEIGIGDTTKTPTVYHHPKYEGLQFWDLPGYGTPKFKLDEKYLQDMNIQQYDFVLIFYSSTIMETDIKFARHLLKMGKKFAMVRTKADEFNAPSMNYKPFDQWVGEVKEKCRATLNQEGITEEVPIYVISNVSPSLGDFDNLINFLSENTPEIKRMNIYVACKWQTSEMIDKKESQLQERTWTVAIAIGLNKALPIPGIDIAFDIILLEEEITFYLEAFQLDEKSLNKYPKSKVKKLKTSREILKVGIKTFIVDSMVKFYLSSPIINTVAKMIPFLGGVITGGRSAKYINRFLTDLIVNLAVDARTLKNLD